jgi:hypothetical protein
MSALHRGRRRTTPLAAAVAVMGLLSTGAAAQEYFNPVDFTEEALFATGDIGVGARAMGLAGAYTAVAEDITALLYNPAGLAQIRRIELGLGLAHQRDRTTHGMFGVDGDANTNRTGLDHLGLAYPFPTYRGSLVVGFGLFRARSTDLDTERRDVFTSPGPPAVVVDDLFLREQRGGVWRLVGGMAVDLHESLSLGGSLSYWRGTLKDDLFLSIQHLHPDPDSTLDFTVRDVSESDLDGFSFDVGLMGYWGRSGRVGLLMRSPTWTRIQGDAQRVTVDYVADDQTLEPFFIDDRPRLPWSAALGLSWAPRNLLVTAEARYTAWEEIELDSGFDPFSDPDTRLPTEREDYASRLGGRAGIEFLLPGLPLRLRGGYAYDPLAYELVLGNRAEYTRQRHVVAAGAGVLVANAFTIDAAVTFASWERTDADFPEVSEERSERRGFLSGAFRF